MLSLLLCPAGCRSPHAPPPRARASGRSRRFPSPRSPGRLSGGRDDGRGDEPPRGASDQGQEQGGAACGAPGVSREAPRRRTPGLDRPDGSGAGGDAPVLLSPQGARLDPSGSNARARHAKVPERAGIERVRADGSTPDLHALRTTYGTRMASAGTPFAALQPLMGHAQVSTTMAHCVHLRAEDSRSAVDAAGGSRPRRRAAHRTSADGLGQVMRPLARSTVCRTAQIEAIAQ